MHFHESRAGTFAKMNEASLAARPWLKSDYSFRPASQHDQAGHEFRALHPYFGWVQAQVGALDFTMFSSNDDGVAMVYHAFGPDSYESAGVAMWAALAPTCSAIADIGSFTGLFAIVGQQLAPQAVVIAIEPNSAVRSRLYINLVANGCYPTVKVAPFAVAGEIGTLPLHVAWGPDILDTGSSLQTPDIPGLVLRSEIVTAAPVDVILKQYNIPPLDLAKIDVEGLEDVALQGASEMLSNHPSLFLEIQNAQKFERCYQVLQKYGYSISGIDDHSISLIPYEGDNATEWFAKNVGARVLNFFCYKRHVHFSLAQNGLSRIRQIVQR